jgi:hypothetical protein
MRAAFGPPSSFQIPAGVALYRHPHRASSRSRWRRLTQSRANRAGVPHAR